MSDPIVFDGVAASWCAERRLSDVDARVLAYLCARAKPRTVIGYFATAAAIAAGFGGQSGRRTFGRSIERLVAAGAVKVLVKPWGHNPGKLEIVCFEELRGMARATRRVTARTMSPAGEIPVLARAPDPISRAPKPPEARARWETHATSPVSGAPGFVPRAPAHGGVLPSEELSCLLAVPDASKQASGSLRDWPDEELSDLVGPLAELCHRTGRPGLTRAEGLLEALRPFSRSQIRHAVSLVSAEVRQAGTLTKPFGFLISAASAAKPEYFPPVSTPTTPTPASADRSGPAEAFVAAAETVVVGAVSAARSALRQTAAGAR